MWKARWSMSEPFGKGMVPCNYRIHYLVLPAGSEQHEAERNLNVIRYLGGTTMAAVPELWWRRENDATAKRFMREKRNVRRGDPERRATLQCGVARQVAK